MQRNILYSKVKNQLRYEVHLYGSSNELGFFSPKRKKIFSPQDSEGQILYTRRYSSSEIESLFPNSFVHHTVHVSMLQLAKHKIFDKGNQVMSSVPYIKRNEVGCSGKKYYVFWNIEYLPNFKFQKFKK